MQSSLENLPPFYVGQKVVCIKSHSEGRYIKGECYTVKGIANKRCKCQNFLIDIGVRCVNDKNYTLENCASCGVYNAWTPVYWFNPMNFVPLQESIFPTLTLSRVIEKELQLTSMN